MLRFYSTGDIGLLNYLFSVEMQFVAPFVLSAVDHICQITLKIDLTLILLTWRIG
jgi:hypothetical protein